MIKGFQFYEGNTTDSATNARITVRKGGILVLTQATVDMLGDGVEAVQVGYNPESRAIALRPAEVDCKGAYRLRSQRNSVSRLVDGKRIFRHHNLIADTSQSYDAETFGDGMIGFTLPAPIADQEEAKEEPITSRKPRRRTPKK